MLGDLLPSAAGSGRVKGVTSSTQVEWDLVAVLRCFTAAWHVQCPSTVVSFLIGA